jgi:hypothetical protein
MKLDRQEVVAVMVALRNWVTTDHQARLQSYDDKARSLLQELGGIDGLEAAAEAEGTGPADSVLITVDGGGLGKTAAEVAKALRDGDPSVRVRLRDDGIVIWTPTLVEGDEKIIAQRLAEIATGG